MAGTFEIKRAKDRSHYFVLKAGNGQVVLQSEMYTTKVACDNGIGSVMENASDDTKFAHLRAKSGQYYFNLKAKNGQIIGTSEMYESKASCENGIKSVMENAPTAKVVDCE